MNNKIRRELSSEEVSRINATYSLIDFNFDTEYIYKLGDLSGLLKEIICQTLSELKIEITEKISIDQAYYVATLQQGNVTMEIITETNTDWLSDDFMEKLERIPKAFGSDKRFYIVIPTIGLTGQDAWYFCGTEANLRKAREEEGLPVLLPEEDMYDFLEGYE